MRKIGLFCWLFLGLISSYAFDLPEKPKEKNKLVFDYAEMLLSIQETLLNNKLITYFDSTSTEIAIVTILSLQGYSIEEVSNDLFNKWEIGSKEKNNGVLILVAQKERKVRIEVGYGLEGALPDLLCNQIIATSIAPKFKNSYYFEGLDEATTDIIQAARGEFKPAFKKPDSTSGFALALIIFFVIFVLLPFLNYKSVSGRAIDDKPINFMTALLMSNAFGHRRGGFDSFSSGSGGFGGFGGGRSGGGGSSGSW